MSAQHWAQVNEAGIITGIRFLFGVYRLLGRWPLRLCLYPVVFYYLLTRREARQASHDYLTRLDQAHPVFGTPPGFKATLDHFTAFAESLLDKLVSWSPGTPLPSVELHGQQAIHALLDAGQGGLIITAHMGNLEFCRALSAQRPGFKLNALSYTRHSAKFNRLLAQINPASKLDMLEVDEITPATAMILASKVAAGEFVVITGDRVAASGTSQLTSAPFLGASAPFPVGPYILASVLRCPVFLMFSIKTDAGYQVSIEPFRDLIELPRGKREPALATLASDFAQRLEHYCIRAPYQWFNFYHFWAGSTLNHEANPHEVSQ